jgi:predicted SAM-dependent methyltransferase
MTIQELFNIGMKRQLPNLATPPTYHGMRRPIIELGAGNNPIPDQYNLGGDSKYDYDLPDWDGTKDKIPHSDNSIAGIYAFHFFEHFTGEQVIRLLRECERVLIPGGVLTTVVPHRLGSMAYQDLDHKSFYMEETWRTLFDNSDYDKNREQPWRFKIYFNVIIGIVERNLALMTQLIKMEV